MIMKARMLLALSVPGALLAAQAMAQEERTPKSAWEFIYTNLNFGGWGADTFYTDGRNIQMMSYVFAGDPGTTKAESTSYCKFKVKFETSWVDVSEHIKPDHAVWAVVDFTKEFTIIVSESGTTLHLKGPVKIWEDYTKFDYGYDSILFLRAPSGQIAERVKSALEFLQKQCAPKSAW